MRTLIGVIATLLTMGVSHAEELAGNSLSKTRAEASRITLNEPVQLAQDAGAAHAESAGDDEQASDNDKWQFNIQPYAWAISLDGDSGLGVISAEIDADFSDIWDALEWAAFVKGDIQYGKLGLLGDILVAGLEPEGDVDIESLDLEIEMAIVKFGVFYEAMNREVKGHRWIMQPFIGGRYVELDVDFDFDSTSSFSDIGGDAKWTDLIIGSRTSIELADDWNLHTENNFGGFGIGGSSDFSYEGSILFGWDMTKRSSLLFGYRYLTIDYDKGSGSNRFEWDASFKGPLIGVNIHF